MFIVVRKIATPNHGYDLGDYSIHSCVSFQSIEAAVAEQISWCNLPPTKCGPYAADVYRNDLRNDLGFCKQLSDEKARQEAEAAEVDKFLTAAGM